MRIYTGAHLQGSVPSQILSVAAAHLPLLHLILPHIHLLQQDEPSKIALHCAKYIQILQSV